MQGQSKIDKTQNAVQDKIKILEKRIKSLESQLTRKANKILDLEYEITGLNSRQEESKRAYQLLQQLKDFLKENNEETF